jgi:hypothetical protein
MKLCGVIITVWHCLALKQFYIKNVGPAKIQRDQQKFPGCWTYVQQNENKFQKVCINVRNFNFPIGFYSNPYPDHELVHGRSQELLDRISWNFVEL